MLNAPSQGVIILIIDTKEALIIKQRKKGENKMTDRFTNSIKIGLAVLCVVCNVITMRGSLAFTPAQELNTVARVKSELLAVAQSHKGEGDPKFEIQKQLEPYVQRLMELAPQPPIAERKDSLVGAWQQVWGPYDYRETEKRGVDPAADPDNIYQVVFPQGYLYNVANDLDRRTQQPRRTILLRGEYTLKPNNKLDVQFTNLRRLNPMAPNASRYVSLPALSETGRQPYFSVGLCAYFWAGERFRKFIQMKIYV
jgi:hypothetical protein